MKNLFISYIMCAAGLLTPFAGLHRFYLDKPVSGVLYLFTWGFFGIGSIIDLIRMPTLVEESNLRYLFTHRLGDFNAFGARLSSPERAVLKCANKNNGIVTVPMVALSSGLSMSEAKIELDRLFREQFCTKDIDEDGNEIYEFSGLKAKASLSFSRKNS